MSAPDRINRLDDNLLIGSLFPMLDEASLVALRSVNKRIKSLVDGPDAVYENQLKTIFPTHVAALIQDARAKTVPVRCLVERCVVIRDSFSQKERACFEDSFITRRNQLRNDFYANPGNDAPEETLRKREAKQLEFENMNRQAMAKHLEKPTTTTAEVYNLNFFAHLDRHLEIAQSLITEHPDWKERFNLFVRNKYGAIILDIQALSLNGRLSQSAHPTARDVILLARRERLSKEAASLRKINQESSLSQGLIRAAEEEFRSSQQQQQAQAPQQ